jgi:hypothetical protein
MTIQDLRQQFIAKYGEGEFHGFFAPGRVNLIGEHTDYNGGLFSRVHSVLEHIFSSGKMTGSV